MNTQSHVDIMDEAIAAIPRWDVFLGARRSEVETQLTGIPGSVVPSAVPPMVLSPVPISLTPTPQAERSAETGDVKAESDGEVAATDARATPGTPGETSPVMTEPASNEKPSTPTAGMTSAAIAVPTDTAGREVAEAPKNDVPPSQPTTLADVKAHFEAILAGINPVTLHPKVREAQQGRTTDPQRFAEILVGAGKQGFLPTALDGAVEQMTGVDPHFRQAQTLYEDGRYAALFKLEPEDDDGDGEREMADEDESEEEGEGEVAY